MGRIALISDIHGNLPALDAVLADIAQRGIVRIICLGDLDGRGPSGAAVIDRIRNCCEAVVRGNWDDGLVDPDARHPMLAWHRARLGPSRLAYLATLPLTLDLVLSNRRIRLLHASPQTVHEHVFPDAPPERLRQMFDNTPLTGDGLLPEFVIYGDTHVPIWTPIDGRVLVNVGSVGSPLDDQPEATYAIIEGQAGVTPGALSVAIVRVPYDVERAIQDAINADMPQWEVYAADLRTGRFTGAAAT
ncbi:MAG: metallophosphoesterase family protein [Thermomicrobiales bacterium]